MHTQTTFQTHDAVARAPSPATQRLRAAKRQRREILESRAAKKIEGVNQLLEGYPDWTTNFYQMLDRFASWQTDIGGATFAGFGYGGMASTINDRRGGKNFPVYQTEVDLQMLRFPSRLLLATNGYAMGMLEALTSYVCGDGFTHEAKEKPGREGRVPKEILAKLCAVIDDAKRCNDWHGGEEPGLEEELFQRGEEDGEGGLCLYEDDAGLPRIVPFEPEQLTAPPGSGEDYRFGILRDRHTGQPLKYWLRGLETSQDGEEYDADQIVFFKNNVKRVMKRGVPSFSFSTADTLTLADSLRRALGTGASIQAGIAIVRQHETATAAQAQSFEQAFADYTVPGPNGSTVPVKKYGAGGIEDIPKGLNYVSPPNATNAMAHVAILQACLRGATARWNAPEWIGSGDASNNNFASALVADAPFTKRTIRTQRRHEQIHQRIFTWVLETRCRRQGVITAVRADGTVVSMAWDELRKLVEVVVKAPSVEVRNKLEEAQANAIRVASGWKSRQTTQAEEGLDPDREQSNIDDWNEKNAPPLPALPMPGAGGGEPAPSGKDGALKGGGSGKEPKEPSTAVKESLSLTPADRSLLESIDRRLTELADYDEHKHPRAKDGKFGSGSGSGAKRDASGATDGAGTDAPEPHLSSVTDAAAKLGADVDAATERDPDLKTRVAAMAVKAGKALGGFALGEMPSWALDLADQWLFEDVLGKAGQSGGVPGAVILTKAAAWTAAKAYLTLRRGKKTVKESDEAEPDVLAVARQLHALLAAIADAAGVEAPAIEELVHKLHEARKGKE